MKYEKMAWAINSRSIEGHSFLGVHIFDHTVRLPHYMRGSMIALFKTRVKAQEALREYKNRTYHPFPGAAISRVKVTIEEM